MNKHLTTLTFAALTCVTATGASAVVLDARSVGLSDTGVASSRGIESVRHNPAHSHHLAKEVDTFAFSWSLGVNAFDEDGLIDDVEDGEDAIDELERKSDAGTVQSGDSEPVIAALRAMDGDIVQIGLDDTMVFGIPKTAAGGNYSYAVSLGVTADVAATFELDDRDVQTIRNSETTGSFDENSLVSPLKASGVAVAELGVTAAREMSLVQLPAPVTIGATFKYQDIRIIDYRVAIGAFDSLSDANDDQNRKDHTGFNVDIGAHTRLNEKLAVGAVIRNLIPKSYSGPLSDDFDSKPQLVAAVNYTAGPAHINFDLDVNKREGFSVLPDRQDAKLGLELRAGNWGQLRLGYRTDLSSNYDDSVSLGFGFSAGSAFNVDLGVFKAGGESLGLGMQIGFAF